MTSIMANKFSLDDESLSALVFFDMTRFWNVCCLAVEQTSPLLLVSSLFSTKVLSASLPFCSVVSKCSAMSSVVFTPDAMFESGSFGVTGFKWVHPALDGVHAFVDRIFILLHAWHTDILALLAFSVVDTCHFSGSLQGLGSVVNGQDPALYCTSAKTDASLCVRFPVHGLFTHLVHGYLGKCNIELRWIANWPLSSTELA